jgi:zinc protease
VVEVRLDNGLTVLLSENHERAEVFGAVVVDVGSKDDPPDDTGMAHYLEHMLFKGTTELGTSDWKAERPLLEQIEARYEALRTAKGVEARSRIAREIDLLSQRAARFAIPNEMDRMLAEMGGRDINAFTSGDVTVYHNTFPASQIETWLEIYAHRFREPVFRLFAPELEAVYEEKNGSMDGFVEPAYDAFMARFFPGHPYGRPILGEVEHLRAPSLQAMRRHFDTWYVANNMALVIAGDFRVDDVLPIIEEKFGTWRKGELPSRDLPDVRPFAGREEIDVRLTPVRAGAIGYRTPPQGHADHPALLVVRQMLANAQGAGALDRLVAEGDLLFADVMEMDFHEHDGTVIFFAPKIIGQSLASAERAIQAELHRFREGTVSEREVAAVRRNLLREIEMQWESNEARALVLADTWARGHSWTHYLESIAALRRVDVKAVALASQRWLGGGHLVARSRRGQPDRVRLPKPDYTPVEPVGGQHSSYYRRIHPLADSDVAPRFVDFQRDVERVETAEGVTVVANPNPLNSVYRLELGFGVGKRDVPELELVGAYLERAGTRTHPREQFAARLYELATTFSAWATEDRFWVRLEGPEDRLEDALALLHELMDSPAVDPGRRRRMRREQWAAERIEKNDPSLVADALWEHALYGAKSQTHRFGHRATRGWSAQDLVRAWSSAQAREVEVRWVGRRPVDELAALVGDRLPFATAPLAAAAPTERARVPLDRDRVFFVPMRDAVQSQVWFFVESDPLAQADAVAMDAYNEYVGGAMGGLVFQEIREFRALAYTAYAGFAQADVAGAKGFLYGYVGCQADKTPETISVMRSLLRDLPRKPERISAVRSSLLRSQESADPGFRELQAHIDGWKRRGYERDPRRDRIPAYRKLQMEDVERFWSAYLKDRPMGVLVVGDPRVVDQSVLERHGPVTRIPRRMLYGKAARSGRAR